MAAGDVVISLDLTFADGRGGDPRLIVGTVTLDGGNPTPIDLSGYLSSIYAAVVALEGSGAPGADPSAVSSGISTTTVNVYAWKITAVGDATLIASTDNARLVNFIAIGKKK